LLVTGAGEGGPKPAAGELKVWDLATGKVVCELPGHAGAVRAVAVSPDGKLLASAGDDRTGRLLRLATGNALTTRTGRTDRVRSVAFAPDGRTLASGGNDQIVKLWDVPGPGDRWLREPRASIAAHRSAVWKVVYAPDGQTFVTGSPDGTVKIWDPV